MLTTLNNLTFDSDTPLTVQRISWSLEFIRFSILTKSVSQSPQRVICPEILKQHAFSFPNALPIAPSTPYNLYAPSTIRDAQCRTAVAPGGCAEANQH